MTKTLAETLDEITQRCTEMEAPLADRLQAFAEEVRRMGEHFAVAVDRMVERLRSSGAGTTAPQPGEPMPPFVLPDETGHLVGLDDLLAKGPVAVAFHRGYWCPYCRINSDALARAERDLAAEGRHIVAVMPDRQKFTTGLKADVGAPFPILTDIDNGYAASLDLAIWVGDELARLMTESGWDPSISQGTRQWTLPIPATFVVGTDGIITARYVDPDYRRRMAIEDLVGALRSAR